MDYRRHLSHISHSTVNLQKASPSKQGLRRRVMTRTRVTTAREARIVLGQEILPHQYNMRPSLVYGGIELCQVSTRDDRGTILERLTVCCSVAFNLLRNAGYEAQQPQADGCFTRSLYISALVYLLDALPPDLTPDETAMLQHRLPESVKSSMPAAAHPQLARPEGPVDFKSLPSSKSYLHRLLAFAIVQVFVIVHFLLPYIRVILRQVYEYERTHRITERVFTAALDVAESLGKRSLDVGNSVCQFDQSTLGSTVGNLAAWWVEGIAGGIYEGIGEGMMHLGLLKPGLDIDRVALQVDRH